MKDTAISVVKILNRTQATKAANGSSPCFQEKANQTDSQTITNENQISLDKESKDLLRALLNELRLQNDIELKKIEIENLKEQLADELDKKAEKEDKARFEKIRHSLYI